MSCWATPAAEADEGRASVKVNRAIGTWGWGELTTSLKLDGWKLVLVVFWDLIKILIVASDRLISTDLT